MEHLSRYDRATVGLWSRSHTELAPAGGRSCLAQAAAHAVLAGLRRCTDVPTLLARYEAGAAADFALIRSLLEAPTDEALWRARDAAFYLRWRELAGAGSSGNSGGGGA
jgi:hypothetical protein